MVAFSFPATRKEVCVLVTTASQCSHEESNLDHKLRKPTFYPLNYGSYNRILSAFAED